MAKTQKYRDELLLEAVVKYAELNRGKIAATKLAEWASAETSAGSSAIENSSVSSAWLGVCASLLSSLPFVIGILSVFICL